MPFIEVKTNQSLDGRKEELKSLLGSAITAVPGKSETWLMVEIDDGLDMWFKGDPSPCVMFEVAVFGSADSSAYQQMTARLCKIAQDCMGIAQDRVYVKYSPVSDWGYNGVNF